MVEVINYDKGSTFHNSLAMIRMGDTNANDGQTVFAFPMGDLGNELSKYLQYRYSISYAY